MKNKLQTSSSPSHAIITVLVAILSSQANYFTEFPRRVFPNPKAATIQKYFVDYAFRYDKNDL